MPCFYLPPERCQGETLQLEGPEGHHAVHVLRIRSGDSVTVLDGLGSKLECKVVAELRSSLSLAVQDVVSVPAPAQKITLVQAVPKGHLFEDIIEKATELGVSRVVPLLSERTIVKLSAETAREKVEKWRLTTISAIKQSGSAWLPVVETPVTPARFLDTRVAPDVAMVGSLGADAVHPREVFRQFILEQKQLPAAVEIWIGPEGDFSPGELELLRSRNVSPITLGPLVLRTETATIYALSVVNYELSGSQLSHASAR